MGTAIHTFRVYLRSRGPDALSMLTGAHDHSSSRSRNRRIRLLLMATAGAVLLGDVAGAERAAGAAASAHVRLATATAGGHAAANRSTGPLSAGPGAPATTTAPPVEPAAPAGTVRHTARPAAPSGPVPRLMSSTVAPVAHAGAVPPAPAPAPPAPARVPAPRPVAATPAPRPAPAPAPRPAPAPAPRPAPAPAPRPAPAPAPAPAGQSTPSDPPASIPPDQNFQEACWTSNPDLQACNQAALTDINHARAQEGLGPLALPSNYYSLSVPAQLVAVSNAERTSRRLPAMPENSSLDPSAQRGAASGQDPTGPSGYTWDSIWALGDPTVLSADYSWMYDDGPGSQNIDCTPSDQSGCWGHRNNILSPWSGSVGAGVATYQGRTSMAELFVKS